jgi:amino acid adenylation domain-containing protein
LQISPPDAGVVPADLTLPFTGRSVYSPAIARRVFMGMSVHPEEAARRREPADPPELAESLAAAFERVAAAFPSRTAVGSDVWEPTYRELNKAANRLADRLIAGNAEPGHCVAILMAHDSPMVAAVLGVLKAGRIVVSLNADDPVSRLKAIVGDAEPKVIVVDDANKDLAAEIAPLSSRILTFELDAAIGPSENPSLNILPGHTAFLTYTSGSTGTPKGVMKTHRQLRSAVAAHTESMQYTENDRIPLLALVSTGQGATALLWTLLNGATLCPFSIKQRGVTGLADWIVARRLTIYASSASIFRTLVKTIDDRLVFSNVRAAWLASESITGDDIRQFRRHFPPDSVLVHGLSSSESSMIAWSRWTADADIPSGTLPVGKLRPDMDVSLLGEDGRPVARGEVGEIVVKSRYVADGYWHDPELTAERFSADLDGTGTRLVRTGDLGRINAGGLLEFCGRKGDRVKIRGNRIELLDIDRAFENLPGIDRAAAVAIPRDNQDPVLVAYVVQTSDGSWTAPRLRRALGASLPLHMVPSRILFLDDLPYNVGNKIDREALRKYPLPARDPGKGEQPRTETEILLADIWAEMFELPGIGRDDDFFSLGGDSLAGAVVGARIHAALGVELSLEAIANHPTVFGLAAFIDKHRASGPAAMPPIARVARRPFMPLSHSQEVVWESCRGLEGTHVRSVRIDGPLDVDIFKECLSCLIDRHEILRTTFDLVDGHPVQIIHPSAPLDFSLIDLSSADDPQRQADSILRDADARTIELEKLPIMRHILIKLADDRHRFARIGHLMVFDGFAARILDSELALLYEARLQGSAPPLAKTPPLQYADYAVWQRQVMQPNNPCFENVVNWWKILLASTPPEARLPFKRLIRRTDLDPSEGVLQWTLGEQAARQLDRIAHGAGATHFIIRLAAFAALVAEVTGKSTVVVGTLFGSRDRAETQNIVGRILSLAPLVLHCDANRPFLEWLKIVRDHLFETSARSELPYRKLCDVLRGLGLTTPDISIVFMLSSHQSDQHFGPLTVSNEFWSGGKMPAGCTVYVDRNPEHCRVDFDAGLYDRNGMRALMVRYLRLLEAVAREPNLPIGALLAKAGTNPPRWTFANYAAPVYERIMASYASSSMLKRLWRPVKKWVFSSG